MSLHSEHLAWAAGFFDGEGCSHLSSDGYFAMTVGQVDRESLDRFLEAVQVGKIFGPYQRSHPTHAPIFHWKAQSHEAIAAFNALRPWLGSMKIKQGESILLVARSAHLPGLCRKGLHKMEETRSSDNRCRLCRNESNRQAYNRAAKRKVAP